MCEPNRRADEFLARPTEVYRASRREIIKGTLAGGLSLSALALLTEEAEADLFTPSAADQKKLGAQAAQEILSKYREVKDSRARSFRAVGEKLVNAIPAKDRGDWDYSFRVVESKEVNAFALPGGPMFMYTGLLDRIRSKDELAAVTGHELEHVRGQHWARQYAGQQKRQLGLAVVLGLAKANRTLQGITGLASNVLNLQYSRGDETSADEHGLRYMSRAGYDPNGMIDLFETLQKASGGGGGPEFLSSHPLTDNRIRHVREEITKLQ